MKRIVCIGLVVSALACSGGGRGDGTGASMAARATGAATPR